MNRTPRHPLSSLALAAAASLAATLAVAGCTSSQYDNDFFDYDPEQSRTRAILDVQYAQGAKDDKTVSAIHFDDEGRLNGLGRDKLDRMLAARGATGRLVVHVDAEDVDAADGEALARAVRDYLAAGGIDVTPDTVVLGPSPDEVPVGPSLAGMDKMNLRSGSGSGSMATGADAGNSNLAAGDAAGLFGGK